MYRARDIKSTLCETPGGTPPALPEWVRIHLAWGVREVS
ncbi:MAG: hypothetical protein JWQ81_3075 [Amycolatopsis sp.]|jgi:hypothetical protein|nr:hypothetical protein [Amycolatopsis sp.]